MTKVIVYFLWKQNKQLRCTLISHYRGRDSPNPHFFP